MRRAAYRCDVSTRYIEPTLSGSLTGTTASGSMIAMRRMRGASRYEQPAVWHPGARHPRHSARDADARLRAAEAAQFGARRLPGVRLRVVVPRAQGPADQRPDRG